MLCFNFRSTFRAVAEFLIIQKRTQEKARELKTGWRTLSQLQNDFGKEGGQDLFDEARGNGRWRKHPQALNSRAMQQVWVEVSSDSTCADKFSITGEGSMMVDEEIAGDFFEQGAYNFNS